MGCRACGVGPRKAPWTSISENFEGRICEKTTVTCGCDSVFMDFWKERKWRDLWTSKEESGFQSDSQATHWMFTKFMSVQARSEVVGSEAPEGSESSSINPPQWSRRGAPKQSLFRAWPRTQKFPYCLERKDQYLLPRGCICQPANPAPALLKSSPAQEQSLTLT